jgi:hypothetical protein
MSHSPTRKRSARRSRTCSKRQNLERPAAAVGLLLSPSERLAWRPRAVIPRGACALRTTCHRGERGRRGAGWVRAARMWAGRPCPAGGERARPPSCWWVALVRETTEFDARGGALRRVARGDSTHAGIRRRCDVDMRVPAGHHSEYAQADHGGRAPRQPSWLGALARPGRAECHMATPNSARLELGLVEPLILNLGPS